MPAADEALKPVTLQLRVRPETRALIENVRQATGVPAVEIAARLFDWYVAQSKQVRAAMLDRESDPTAVIANERLAKMAAAGAAPDLKALSVEQATNVIRLMLDAIEQSHGDLERAARQHLPAPKKKG